MRFGGKEIRALATAEVIIPRPDHDDLVFLVRALRFGEEDDGEDIFPDAVPPYGFLKDEKGLPLRDGNEKAVHAPLLDDPGYVKQQSHAEDMRVIVKLVKVLDHDARVTWDTTKPANTAGWYEDIKAEITQAGLSLGDLHVIVRKANELGNVDGSVLERVAEAFSRREQKAKADQ